MLELFGKGLRNFGAAFAATHNARLRAYTLAYALRDPSINSTLWGRKGRLVKPAMGIGRATGRRNRGSTTLKVNLKSSRPSEKRPHWYAT